MKITRTSTATVLSQEPNISEILVGEQMTECNPKKTPMEENLKLTIVEEQKDMVDQTKYRSIIGKLMYVTRCTRPDITAATCILSRFSHGPGQEHKSGSKTIISISKRIKRFEITFYWACHRIDQH